MVSDHSEAQSAVTPRPTPRLNTAGEEPRRYAQNRGTGLGGGGTGWAPALAVCRPDTLTHILLQTGVVLLRAAVRRCTTRPSNTFPSRPSCRDTCGLSLSRTSQLAERLPALAPAVGDAGLSVFVLIVIHLLCFPLSSPLRDRIMLYSPLTLSQGLC